MNYLEILATIYVTASTIFFLTNLYSLHGQIKIDQVHRHFIQEREVFTWNIKMANDRADYWEQKYKKEIVNKDLSQEVQ